jgi:hypothetical protein
VLFYLFRLTTNGMHFIINRVHSAASMRSEQVELLDVVMKQSANSLWKKDVSAPFYPGCKTDSSMDIYLCILLSVSLIVSWPVLLDRRSHLWYIQHSSEEVYRITQ